MCSHVRIPWFLGRNTTSGLATSSWRSAPASSWRRGGLFYDRLLWMEFKMNFWQIAENVRRDTCQHCGSVGTLCVTSMDGFEVVHILCGRCGMNYSMQVDLSWRRNPLASGKKGRFYCVTEVLRRTMLIGCLENGKKSIPNPKRSSTMVEPMSCDIRGKRSPARHFHCF